MFKDHQKPMTTENVEVDFKGLLELKIMLLDHKHPGNPLCYISVSFLRETAVGNQPVGELTD